MFFYVRVLLILGAIAYYYHFRNNRKKIIENTRTCGGSSGGEGALIGARGSLIGIGTDVGGSVRIPCHFTGIAGIKPSKMRFAHRGGGSSVPGKPMIDANEGSMAQDVKTNVEFLRNKNTDLLTFLAWIIIVGFIYLHSLLALKFITIRVIIATVAFLPIAIMLAFFIFRIPQLTNEPHKTQFFATWKVGGHRGSAHDDMPENSLEAFSAVKSEGGQLAEMDIQVTKDGVPVICHDSNTVRVTGVDKDISTMNITEFRDLRFIGTNISLPTFEEAVAHCVANDLMMIWDVKNVDENLLKQFVSQIRTHNLYSKVLVSGFNPIDTYKVKMADPKILTGLTWRSWQLSTTDESATIPKFCGALHALASVLDVLAFGLARSLIVPKFLGSDVIFYHVNDISRFLKSDAAANNIYLAGWTSNTATEQVWLRDFLNVPFLTDNVGTVPH